MPHSDDRLFPSASNTPSAADREAQLCDGRDKAMLDILRQQHLTRRAQAIIDVQKLLHGEASG
ncbi:MAG TPA: hypothetical protein VJ955_05880, partial [Desulfuromonadales bacterium]|nr:hypothetical protein [Desulfuromonadales bacterium]